MLARLRERGPGLDHRMHFADLTSLSEMKRVAREIAAAEPRIDVLMNNAGAMFSELQITEDGFERTFALNHMSYFVLSHGLREASGGHRGPPTGFAQAPWPHATEPLASRPSCSSTLWRVVKAASHLT